MTYIEFYEKIYSILNDQNYRITFAPAKKKNYMIYCNSYFIGGLFDDELCLVYSSKVDEMLSNPEPVFRGYTTDAQHKMLVVSPELAKEALVATYKEKFDGDSFVYDFTYTSKGASVLEDFYDDNVIFLRFCFENGLLKEKPLDKNNRIICTHYIKRDLTNKGVLFFDKLLYKFLAFRDGNGKTDLGKMLKRWFTTFDKTHTL